MSMVGWILGREYRGSPLILADLWDRMDTGCSEGPQHLTHDRRRLGSACSGWDPPFPTENGSSRSSRSTELILGSSWRGEGTQTINGEIPIRATWPVLSLGLMINGSRETPGGNGSPKGNSWLALPVTAAKRHQVNKGTGGNKKSQAKQNLLGAEAPLEKLLKQPLGKISGGKTKAMLCWFVWCVNIQKKFQN